MPDKQDCQHRSGADRTTQNSRMIRVECGKADVKLLRDEVLQYGLRTSCTQGNDDARLSFDEIRDDVGQELQRQCRHGGDLQATAAKITDILDHAGYLFHSHEGPFDFLVERQRLGSWQHLPAVSFKECESGDTFKVSDHSAN